MVTEPQKLPSLSVFFPAYNEEANLPHLLKQTYDVMPQFTRQLEVIVVNDGSVDNTKSIVKKFQKEYPNLKLVSHPKNLGYGAALKSGFKAASYEWIFFTDADLQFDLKEFKNFLPFTKNYKAILGYRVNRAEGFHRALNARLLKMFVDALFRVHVKDIDCAFKLLKNEVVKSLKLESDGAFVSSEMLYKLKKNKVKFKQLPVSHYPRKYGSSTGANPLVILKAMRDAFKIYIQTKLGRLKEKKW